VSHYTFVDSPNRSTLEIPNVVEYNHPALMCEGRVVAAVVVISYSGRVWKWSMQRGTGYAKTIQIPSPLPMKPLRLIQLSIPVLIQYALANASADGVRDDKPITMQEMVVKETKTHTLFMGCDIAISLDRDLYPVRDVFGSNWVVDINGQQKEISSKQAPLNLKITPALKLTEVSATILGFKREAAYSFDNDPSVRITKGLTHSASMSADLQANGENAMNRVDTILNKATGGAGILAGADDQFSANAMLTTAEYLYSDLHSTAIGPGGLPIPNGTAPTAIGDPLDLGSLRSNPLGLGALPPTGPSPAKTAAVAATRSVNQSANGDEPLGRLATQGLDALEIEFDITATKPLSNPYVVTISRYRAPGAKPGFVQNLVYARAIDPINTRLTHVHFTEDGFPFNYEMTDFQLHVYNRGVEIATNISSHRVELTRDEAFEYIKLEYLSSHKGSTLPATAVMGQLPADLPTRLAAGNYSHSFYVRVSKDGMAQDAFLDAACTKRIDDPYLVTLVGRVRFKPALADGKPIDSIAELNLNRLTI
jgi:hypothetical protein